jgi:hypothetical protein
VITSGNMQPSRAGQTKSQRQIRNAEDAEGCAASEADKLVVDVIAVANKMTEWC